MTVKHYNYCTNLLQFSPDDFIAVLQFSSIYELDTNILSILQFLHRLLYRYTYA